MAAERRISILIDTQGNPAGIDLVEKRLSGLESSADSLFETLKMGVGIDIGGRLVSGLAQVPAAFDRAIQRGVQFNAQIETAQLGIAAILRQFDTEGRFESFNDAMRASAEAIELLKQKAKESPATFAELVSAFQGTAGAMAAANIPLERQVDLIVNMSQALSGLGIHSSQILQETRALITGNINANAAAAKILGITTADVNAAKAQGQLYEFLSGKISAFAEAGARGATTMTAALSNLEDAIDNVLAQVTKPIFEAMTKGTLDLKAALEDPKIVESLRSVGIEISKLVRAGYQLTEWAIENQELLVFLARAATAYGVAITAIKLTDLLTGLGKKAIALTASKTALDAETAALSRNTAAQAANTAARRAGGGSINAPAGWGQAGRAAENARKAAEAAEFEKRVLAARRGQWVGPVAPLNPLPPRPAAPGVTAGGILAGVSTVATAAIVTYVIGELIAQGVIARAEARAARVAAAGEASFEQTTGLSRRVAQTTTAAEQVALMKEITDRRREASRLLAENIFKDETLAGIYRRQVHTLDLLFDRLRSISAEDLVRRRTATDTTAELERQRELLAAMADKASELSQAYEALRSAEFDALSDENKLITLGARRADLDLRMPGLERAAATGGEAETRALFEAKRQALELDRAIAQLAEKIAAEAKKAADETQKTKEALDGVLEATERTLAARQDITSEILIAEARARGEDEIADRLERQKRLREEIRRIVEATGVSEAEAERAARRLILAQEAAAKRGRGEAPGATNVPTPKRRIDETYDETNRRLGGAESYDERNVRLSGGRWTPPPAVQTVPSMTRVVPAAPTAPSGAPAAGGAAALRTPASTQTLIDLTREAVAAIGTKQEEEAAEALRSYHDAMSELLAAGDKRYAEVVAQLKIALQELQGLKARANTKG